MKQLPKSWKVYSPLLALLFLALTLAGDYFRPLPEKAAPKVAPTADHAHSHTHDDATGKPVSPDQAFNQAPKAGAVPPDPEKEHRMAIFHYNEGNRFLNKSDWQEAVHNYKMALHHDKGLKEVYINMSTALLKGQQYEEAQKMLATLKGLDPNHPHLYYNLACYYSLTHQEVASLEALQQSFQLGYESRKDIHTDPDLENLRQTSEFRQWLKTWDANR